MGHACTLTVTANAVDGAAVLIPHGILDSSTYRSLRDTVIEAALEEPRAVIIDVGQLAVPAETAWMVFASARWHVAVWPNTPILLVCEQPESRSALCRSGVSRRVPVCQTIDAALATLRPFGVVRHRARADLPADLTSLNQSRELVEHWLTAWTHAELIPVTQVIITALVENVLKHTDSRPCVRLETDGAAVTVAVEDANHAQASIRETAVGAAELWGLRIVHALCRQWGNAPTLSGKTVWAVVGPENRL
jgi:anti-anti-sigma regulatory factor